MDKKVITRKNNRMTIQYTIDEKNKKITCYAEEKVFEVLKKLDRVIQVSHGGRVGIRACLYYGKDIYDSIGYGDKVYSGYGVAQCKGDDKFSLEKGMKIAKAQALRMIYETKMTDFNTLMQRCFMIGRRIMDFKLKEKERFYKTLNKLAVEDEED